MWTRTIFWTRRRWLGRDEFAGAAAIGRPLIGIYTVKRRDGSTIPIEVHELGIVRPDGELVGHRGVMRDITDRQKAEDTQRLAALGQLAAGVAHEFNNLLAGLMLQAEFAAADRTVERYDGLVTTASSVASRGSDVYRTSRPRPPADPRREAVEAERMVESALALSAQQIANSAVVVTRDYQTEGWGVQADSRQMEQVFLDIVVNACHAMPDGGRLTIETRRVPALPGSAGDIVVAVTDTGTVDRAGAPAADLRATLHHQGAVGPERHPGVGLGLSVSTGSSRPMAEASTSEAKWGWARPSSWCCPRV